jgi:hypothetical protein
MFFVLLLLLLLFLPYLKSEVCRSQRFFVDRRPLRL